MWENQPARICEKISQHAFVRKWACTHLSENQPTGICEKIKPSFLIKRQMSLTVVTHNTYICPYVCIFSQIEFCICKSLCVCLKVEFFFAKQIVFICKTLDLFDKYWHKIRSIDMLLKLEKCIPISHVTLETVPKYANIKRPTSSNLYASSVWWRNCSAPCGVPACTGAFFCPGGQGIE